MTAINTAKPDSPQLELRKVVWLLGISQIVGYGTIFYSYAIIAPSFAKAFGVDPSLPFSVISIALLLSGLVSPFLGKLIDRQGAQRVMVLGSLLVGAIYILAAAAPSFAILAGLFVLLQVIGVSVLYGASFPTLAQFGGDEARRAITQLTLIAGFASTLFWPLTGWLAQTLDWRFVLLIFAALHLGVALPVHVYIARRAPKSRPRAASPAEDSARGALPLFTFSMIALSFGITGIVSTALVVHLVPILNNSNLGETTYFVSMIVGPAMVLVRLGEAFFWSSLHPLLTTILATLCFPIAILLLLSGMPPVLAGSLFAVFYGFGHGLNVIVGGTLPLHYFGRDGYGELLGRLNAIRVLLSAGAPAAFSLALPAIGFGNTMFVLAGIGLVATIPLLVLGQRLRAHVASDRVLQ